MIGADDPERQARADHFRRMAWGMALAGAITGTAGGPVAAVLEGKRPSAMAPLIGAAVGMLGGIVIGLTTPPVRS